jgi:hypothetical protein
MLPLLRNRCAFYVSPLSSNWQEASKHIRDFLLAAKGSLWSFETSDILFLNAFRASTAAASLGNKKSHRADLIDDSSHLPSEPIPRFSGQVRNMRPSVDKAVLSQGIPIVAPFAPKVSERRHSPFIVTLTDSDISSSNTFNNA